MPLIDTIAPFAVLPVVANSPGTALDMSCRLLRSFSTRALCGRAVMVSGTRFTESACLVAVTMISSRPVDGPAAGAPAASWFCADADDRQDRPKHHAAVSTRRDRNELCVARASGATSADIETLLRLYFSG